MRGCFLLALLLPLSSSAAGWVELFDGETTNGWTPRGEVIRFEARDGELHLHAENNVWVTSDTVMGDFEVELEVKLPDDAAEVGFNSGLGFRLTGESGKPKGYQSEIDRNKPAGIHIIGTGWLHPRGDEAMAAHRERAQAAFRDGEWNHFRVEARGSELKTWLNGKLLVEKQGTQYLRGAFGIQHHGKGRTVKFRNIRARPLHPNILWITAEDMSPALGCYGDEYATTPNLDALAEESVVYTNAFAASPVCSPSRSCLITGMQPVSMATHQMRSELPLPTGVHGFPTYLREAGYFTTNNVKTDYNTADHERLIRESWDESSPSAHWRDERRAEGQPFFAVFNDMTSHQSRTMVWPYEVFVEHVQSRLSPEQIHDPETVPLPPYYPDTPVTRRAMARFYDCVTVMDQNTGRILDQLEEDGLAEDTIVFFYSDHGSGMPRHKRLLFDSGMRVALMVRFPQKYRHLADGEPGTRTDRLVSFVDFPATTLHLAGLGIPPYMQGKIFLGQDPDPPRDYVYGSRDRVDEVHEMARSVRDKQYLYIRNYLPYLSHNQPSVFSDLGAIRDELTRLARPGNLTNLTPAQRDYAGPTKPAEALYDVQADPHQIHNLLEGELSPERAEALQRMRSAYRRLRGELGDPGALPESEVWKWIRQEGMPMRDIVVGRSSHRPDLDELWKAADQVGMGSEQELLALLQSPHASERYWGVIGLRQRGSTAFANVEPHLEDVAPSVRIEAADWLAREDAYQERALAVLVGELDHEDWWTALRACRTLELLGEKARPVEPAIRALYDRTRGGKGDENLYLAFSAGAWLDAMGEPTIPWDFTPGAGNFSADPDEDDRAESSE